ncbi:N-ATPase subunit AtpR [Myxosarcina sp. GI1(2024)]
MESILFVLSALIPGIILGIFYFGSLWITVRQLPTTAYPIRLFIGSFLGRTIVTLFGFYLVMDGQWQRIAICLAGFVAARILLTRLWRPQHQLDLKSKEE